MCKDWEHLFIEPDLKHLNNNINTFYWKTQK
jgi:hypothetical protein